MNKVVLFLLLLSFLSLVFLTPLYGDPAVVFWTAKVMKITGFPYDPVCTRNIQDLCVRSPMYYFLLSLTSDYYRIMLALVLISFFVLQIMVAGGLSRLNLTGMLFPPIYLMFSRTYVDALTALLFTLLVYVILKPNQKWRFPVLFLTTAMIVLVRETALTLPVFFMILVVMRIRLRLVGIMSAGWGAGLAFYMMFLATSGGVSYSDFQQHIPSLNEVYRAVYSILTPVLPWEVNSDDIRQYLTIVGFPGNFLHAIWIILQAFLHLIPLVFMIPFLLSVRTVLSTNRVLRAQFLYGLLVSVGLLFLKGDIDFFRHTAFLLPSIPVMISAGMDRLGYLNKRFVFILVIFSLLVFIMYFFRQLRAFLTGYEFDACAYLMKRAEINDIWFFREAACG